MSDTASVSSDDRGFAASTFNRTWDYLVQQARSEEETEAMIHASHASLWHWMQVPERTPANISVGYWLLSRVYAIAGQGEAAWHYAERCRRVTEEAGLRAFYLGYACEALARAARLRGNAVERDTWRSRGIELAATVTSKEERELLERDLAGF